MRSGGALSRPRGMVYEGRMSGTTRHRTADAPTARRTGRPLVLLVNGLHAKSGGGVTYLANVLPLFAAEPDVEVHLCVHRDQATLPFGGGDAVRRHVLDFRTGFWRLLVREQIEVPRLARRIGADVVFSPANYGPLGAPCPVLLLRNALDVAGVERRPVKVAYWALLSLATAASLLSCRRAVAVSAYAARAASGPVPERVRRRIAVVPHGVGPPFAPPPAGADREPFVLAVSDLYVQKNLDTLIRAFAAVARDRPALALRIAGRPVDEDYAASLRRTVATLRLDSRVTFLGHVGTPELAGLYRRCAAFVFPSTVETFGNPLLEAMASGAPVACSDAAAMPEVAGDAALLFDPRDEGAVAAAITRLLDDTDLARDLGRRAAERAAGFTWRETAARTLAVIREAAGRASDGS